MGAQWEPQNSVWGCGLNVAQQVGTTIGTMHGRSKVDLDPASMHSTHTALLLSRKLDLRMTAMSRTKSCAYCLDDFTVLSCSCSSCHPVSHACFSVAMCTYRWCMPAGWHSL